MVIGIGVDVVDLARFERALARTPQLRARLFTEREQRSGTRLLSSRSLAGRFAAKEALIKALGEATGVRWHDMQVVSDEHGNPFFELDNAAREIARTHGVASIHLSMSHDAGIAIAYVVTQS
jgi:holo-[acyl-carrier protein] synthase